MLSGNGPTRPRVIRVGGPCRGSPRLGGRSSRLLTRRCKPMKVHDDQSETNLSLSGPPPVGYSPSVLVSTLPESWPINQDRAMAGRRARNPRWEPGMGMIPDPRQIGDGDGSGRPIPGESGMGMPVGVDPRSSANRGWGWGWTPDPRRIGDGGGDGPPIPRAGDRGSIPDPRGWGSGVDWKAVPAALDRNQPTTKFGQGLLDRSENPLTDRSSGIGPMHGIEP